MAMLEVVRDYAEKSGFDLEKTERVLDFLQDLGNDDEVDLAFTFKVAQQLVSFRPDEPTLFAVLLYDLYLLPSRKKKNEFQR